MAIAVEQAAIIADELVLENSADRYDYSFWYFKYIFEQNDTVIMITESLFIIMVLLITISFT